MKASTFTFLILLLVLNCFSQEIPNNEFETWIKPGNYEDPQHWTTPNAYLSALMTSTVSKEITNVHSGIYSAHLENKDILGGLYKVPGFMTLGNFSVNTTTLEIKVFGGIPFTKKPSKLKGSVNYSPGPGGDEGLVAVILFKHDTVLNKIDTIGFGNITIDSTVNWEDFEVWINYINQSDPDSLNIVFLSSQSMQPPLGTVMLIDSLYFDFSTGVSETPSAKFQYFLSQNVLRFADPSLADVNYCVYNVFGEKILEGKVNYELQIILPEKIKGLLLVSLSINNENKTIKVLKH